VTWQYSQKNEGHPPENVQIRPNQRLTKCDLKIGRCEWLWKLTPISMPEIQPSIDAAPATKAIRDQGPAMPASLGCRYSQKAHAYATRQIIWKITQCLFLGVGENAPTAQRGLSYCPHLDSRRTSLRHLAPLPSLPSLSKAPKASFPQ